MRFWIECTRHETGATLSRQYLASRRHVARAGLIAIPVSDAS